MKQKHTDWVNEPTFAELKKDYDSAQISYSTHLERLEFYKSVYKDDGGLKNSSKSSYKSKLYRKQLEWVYPNLEEPILNTRNMFNVNPLSNGSVENADLNRKAINYQWNELIAKASLINKASRAFSIEGTCVIKIGWDFKTEDKVEVAELPIYASTDEELKTVLSKVKDNPKLHETILSKINNGEQIQIGIDRQETIKQVITRNQPKYEVRANEAVIVDPKCNGVQQNIQFVIDTYETDYSTLKTNDSYFNLDKIEKFLKSDDNKTSEYYLTTGTEDLYDFQFSDLARKKVTMYEYWGYWDIDGTNKLKPIVASWINDTLVRMEENPYPHKKIPYVFGQYSPIKNEIWGEPNAELLKNDQDSLSTVTRAMQDITSENAVGQEFIDESMFSNPVQRDNYNKGRTVFTKKGINPKDAIHRKSVEPVPTVLFDMLQMYSSEANKITGILDYYGKKETSFKSSNNLDLPDDAASNREMSVLRRFTSMFAELGTMTLAMNKEFLLPDSMTVNDDGSFGKVEDVVGLEGMYGVSVEIATPRLNNAKATRIVTMMQTNAANMSPELAGLHYKKIADLWNIDDLSDAIMDEINKEPTEQEKMLQQLQLENVQLENKKLQLELLKMAKDMEESDSRIRERDFRYTNEESQADIVRKKAQAELDLAQASKLDAQTGLFKQEFDLIGSGEKRNYDKQDNEFNHLANLEREEVRTDRELKNIDRKKQVEDKGASKQPNSKEANKEELLSYIRQGTLENESYDPVEDVYRNILTKNSYEP